MREIKFRVFDKCHKSMHIVGEDTHDSLTCYDGIVQYYNLQNGEGSGEHGDYILMQYTGLKDKNGKEIYEGDILKVDDDWEKWGFTSGFVGYVIYHKGSFMLKEGEIYTPKYRLDSATEEGTTVIGNLYENPELLEEIK